MKTLARRRFVPALVCALALVPGLAAAGLQALSEDELSTVNGQDGIEYYISSPTIGLTALRIDSDNTALPALWTSPCTGPATCGGMWANGLQIAPIGGPTAVTGYVKLDTGAQTNASMPWFSYDLHLDQVRLGGTLANTGFSSGIVGSSTRSFGQFAMVTPLDFRWSGQPFYGLPQGNVDVLLSVTNARLFYRQNGPTHANIALNNLNFIWRSPTDMADIQLGGFRMGGPASTFNVAFDLLYKYNADQDMATITANDRPIMRFSWGGTLYDSHLYLRGGGVWNTAVNQATNVAFNAAGDVTNNMPAGATQGLSVGMRWNYRSSATPLVAGDFLWSIGHASGDREYLQFGDWKNLEQATGVIPDRYGFDFPLLVIDNIAAGDATNAGGSLCWGNAMTNAACNANIDGNADGDFTDVHVDNLGTLITLRAGTIEGYAAPLASTATPAMMQVIRNGNLLAWSNQVRVMRDPSILEGDYAWGLIYTLPNINSNIYMYPGGSESDTAGGSRNHGAIFDVLMMTQSFGQWQSNYLTTSGGTCNAGTGAGCTNTTRWNNGAHFMIADTGAQMGIGFLGSSILMAIDDMRIWLKNTTAGQAAPANWDGGIDMFSPRTRINMRGLFAGVRLPRGHDLVRGAYIDMNLEGIYNFRLSPPPSNVVSGQSAESNDFVAYSMAARLRCGADVGVVFNFGCTNNTFTDAAGSIVKSGVGSYISIEEPGFPGVDLRWGDLSGDLAVTEGTLQLRSGTDTDLDTAPNTPVRSAGARPELVIAQKILVGASAAERLTDGVTGVGVGVGGAAGRTLTTNASFGGNYIWSMAIPAGSMYSAITLLPQ